MIIIIEAISVTTIIVSNCYPVSRRVLGLMTVIKYAQLHPDDDDASATYSPCSLRLILFFFSFFWVQLLLRAPSLLLDHILDALSITVDHGAN